MAQSILQGVQQLSNVEGRLLIDVEATMATLEDVGAIIIGTPTYHHDIPEGIKHFFESLATQANSFTQKIGASFGSFGWSGEAPRLVLEIMEHKFNMNVIKPPLLIKYRPDKAALTQCHDFGKRVAEQLIVFKHT